jgi:hypothetical protein
MTKIGTYQLNRMIACLAASSTHKAGTSSLAADVHALTERAIKSPPTTGGTAIIKYTWQDGGGGGKTKRPPPRNEFRPSDTRAHQNRRGTLNFAVIGREMSSAPNVFTRKSGCCVCSSSSICEHVLCICALY